MGGLAKESVDMAEEQVGVGRAVERAVVLGAGQMGLVMAQVLAQRGELGRVSLWCHDEREAEGLAQTRRSGRLELFELDGRVEVTSDAGRAFGGGVEGGVLVINAVPTQFVRGCWEGFGGGVTGGLGEAEGVGFVSVSKGIENGTLLSPLGVIADCLGCGVDGRFGVLSGPTIAGELARGLPATMVVASGGAWVRGAVQRLMTTSYLRVYTSGDTTGVELAGACKNVVAIAAGIIDGLNAGFNAKSALLARGLAEITRLGNAMGAQAETFFGIAGLGDLATTCFSPEGRNRSLGEALGKGETLSDYLARTDSVVEGVATAESVMALKQKFGVEMPISEAVARVLTEEMDPLDGITALMSRELKEERVG